MPGTFFGYREVPVVPSRPPRLRQGSSTSAMKLTSPMLETLASPGYTYVAFNGAAPADYPDKWITLETPCRMASWRIQGGPLEIQTRFEGVAVGETVSIRASTTMIGSFVAFRVRQLIPGHAVTYQLLATI